MTEQPPSQENNEKPSEELSPSKEYKAFDDVKKRNIKNRLQSRKKRRSKHYNDYNNAKKEEQTLEKALKIIEGKEGLVEESFYDDEALTPSAKDLLKDKEIAWEPNPGPQVEFLKANEDEVLFAGGRGSGKSDCLIIDPLRYCTNKKFRGLLIRRTMPELRDLIKRAKDVYPLAYPGVKWREQEKIFVFPSGARIEFGYADKDDDVERYRGQEYTWLGIDEITQYSTSDILEKLKSSLRTTDPTLPIYIRATCNPTGSGRGWVKSRWIDKAPSGERINIEVDTPIGKFTITRKWIHSTVLDNPKLLKANPQYIATLASLDNEFLRRQWLEGDWTAADGLAFPEFDPRIHVVKDMQIPRSWPKFRACDWGYSSMAACLWYAIDFDNNIYVYREYTCKLLTADTFAQKILELEKDDNIRAGYLDSSVWARRGEIGETPVDTMNRFGLYFYPSDRSPGARKAGKLLLHKYLQKDPITNLPKLFIHESCREIIKELSELMLDKNDNEDVDTDMVDHAYDALRYGLLARPDVFAKIDPFGVNYTRTKPAALDSTFGY